MEQAVEISYWRIVFFFKDEKTLKRDLIETPICKTIEKVKYNTPPIYLKFCYVVGQYRLGTNYKKNW